MATKNKQSADSSKSGDNAGEQTKDAVPVSSESLTRTVKLPLQTSTRKLARLEQFTSAWQEMASTFADNLVSVHPAYWGETQETWQQKLAETLYPTDRLKTLPLRPYKHDRNEALYKVSAAFGSWKERGKQGDRPTDIFGTDSVEKRNESYGITEHANITYDEHTPGQYGVKLKLEAYGPDEWFGINGGRYQDKYLDAITRGDNATGHAEIRVDTDANTAHLHQTVRTTHDVYDPDSLSRWVGVDLGERTLYSAAVVDRSTNPDSIQDVQIESGDEFRHHRNRLDTRLKEKMEQKHKDKLSHQRQRYTNQVTNRITREIVKLAVEHSPAGIRVEDLTGYRQTAADPIHDWPQNQIRTQLAYKATQQGIPVLEVPPAHTSVTCRKCGVTDEDSRVPTNPDIFNCTECGYEVHADLNAAINIATGGIHET